MDRFNPRGPVPSLSAVVERCYANAYGALASGKPTAAGWLFALLAVMEPRGERAWAGLGACHERTDKTAAALALYSLGHTLTGGSAWLGLGRARTLRTLGRAREAEAAFDAAQAATDDPRVRQAIEEERCPT